MRELSAFNGLPSMAVIHMVATVVAMRKNLVATTKKRKGKKKVSLWDKSNPQGKQKCAACGSDTHQCSSHKECPFNKRKGGIVCAKEEKPITVLEEGHKSVISSSDCSPDDDDVLSDVGYFDNVLSDVDSDSELCTCGSKAHTRNCPMNSRKRYPGRSLFPPQAKLEESKVPNTSSSALCTSSGSLKPPSPKKMKPQLRVGDNVCVHSRIIGQRHVPCRIVGNFGGRCKLYCSKGVLKTSFLDTELISCVSIPLDKW